MVVWVNWSIFSNDELEAANVLGVRGWIDTPRLLRLHDSQQR
jgi:hypothetical protein